MYIIRVYYFYIERSNFLARLTLNLGPRFLDVIRTTGYRRFKTIKRSITESSDEIESTEF